MRLAPLLLATAGAILATSAVAAPAANAAPAPNPAQAGSGSTIGQRQSPDGTTANCTLDWSRTSAHVKCDSGRYFVIATCDFMGPPPRDHTTGGPVVSAPDYSWAYCPRGYFIAGGHRVGWAMV